MADTNPIVAELMKLADAYAKVEYMRAIHKKAPSDYEPARAALESRLAELFKGEPVAWMTHHDEPMLFPTREEAALHCEEGEEPRPLYLSPPTPTEAGDGNWRAISECSYIGTIGPCTPTEAGAGELLRELVACKELEDSRGYMKSADARYEATCRLANMWPAAWSRAREWVRNNPKE